MSGLMGIDVRKALLVLTLGACSKVGISGVNAGFLLSDATWFEEEQTIFFFYDVRAEQGLGEPSQIEVRYTTDDEDFEWTALTSQSSVHTHIPVDCGANHLCGSFSLPVEKEPRNVGLRLRYHRDGELALPSEVIFNAINSGPAHTNRSLLIYGVFDGNNTRVQWRARHQFPTLRNEEAERFGLRRFFAVDNQRTGTLSLSDNTNPYGYGATCPNSFSIANLDDVNTDARAVYTQNGLELIAAADSAICGRSTVTDATGEFRTAAIARKNPQVRPAFPLLRSPVRPATPLKFFLAPCNRTISALHEAMQRQRTLNENGPTFCTDNWTSPSFVDDLAADFETAIEAERVVGNDMVLVIGLHREQSGVADKLEEALQRVIPAERDRATPRLVGAFVLDSNTRLINDPALRRLVLWCPSSFQESEFELSTSFDPSLAACALLPDNPSVMLGPFSFGGLPLLPDRRQYLDFVDSYSVETAGEVLSASYLAPVFSAATDNSDLLADDVPIALASFFDGEVITAGNDDVFSFCGPASAPFVFRSALTQTGGLGGLEDCAPDEVTGEIDPATCFSISQDFLPIQFLPQWHAGFVEDGYELGLAWDFPFLLQMNFSPGTAASVSAFGFSVPFGFRSVSSTDLGTGLWRSSEFSLDALLQCTRFCEHPTFDSVGIYNIRQPFGDTYLQRCYQPKFPSLTDGFPNDP